MEVILRDHVEHVGRRGEIVKVADGFARNYLLPRKLALPATDGNKRWVERERKIVEAREAEERGAAEAIATRLTALELSIARRVGENDQLYGSVTNADIADLLKAKGFEIDRRKILLPDPLKALEVVVLFIIVQEVEGNLVQPFVMSWAVRIDPLLVLIAITIGAEALGLVGAVIAVPVAGMAQVITQRVVAPAIRHTTSANEATSPPAVLADASASPPADPAPTSAELPPD